MIASSDIVLAISVNTSSEPSVTACFPTFFKNSLTLLPGATFKDCNPSNENFSKKASAAAFAIPKDMAWSLLPPCCTAFRVPDNPAPPPAAASP